MKVWWRHVLHSLLRTNMAASVCWAKHASVNIDKYSKSLIHPHVKASIYCSCCSHFNLSRNETFLDFWFFASFLYFMSFRGGACESESSFLQIDFLFLFNILSIKHEWEHLFSSNLCVCKHLSKQKGFFFTIRKIRRPFYQPPHFAGVQH